MRDDTPTLDTLAVHAGLPGRVDGAITFPIFQSATYAHSGDGVYEDVRYARLSNTPSHAQLHAKLAAICGAEAAVVTSSGMSAIASTLLTLLGAGDHALFQSSLYGGTHALVTRDLARLGVAADLVAADAPETWSRALRPTTRVFYVESISNPLARVTDLSAVVAFARAHGLVTVVDNTFASPANLRPLALGVDVEVHSATKYLAGHSDVIAGAVVASAAHVRAITQRLDHFGGCLDPHACFLLERGIKTLALRAARQNANASALASWLADHPAVARVHYPGVGADNPVPEGVRGAFAGFGGVLSFTPRARAGESGASVADRVIAGLRLIAHAPSLGGVETLVTRPATTSHAGMSPAERAASGIDEGLIRVACGIEAEVDLRRDLGQALDGGGW